MENTSMRSKIFIYMILFTVVLISFLWLFQIVFLDDFYEAIKTRELEKNGELLVKNYGKEDFENIAREIAFRYGINIEITWKNVTAFFPAHGGYQPFPKGNSSYENTEDSLIRNYFRMEESRRSLDFLEYNHVLNVDGEEVYFKLTSIISPVDATVNTLRVQIIIISIIMLLISIIISTMIANKLSAPIMSINESTKKLAEGNYDIEFTESGYKEIKELSNTMNYTVKELGKVDSLRRELISNVSHDLRTPLTLIGGYAEAMRDLPDEVNKENIQIIIDEVGRLNNLITSLMDLSKLESGSTELNMEKFNLTRYLDSLIKNTKALLSSAEYKIDFYYDEEIVIDADRELIGQAFNNLLFNGINYGEGEVEVRQILDGESVRIEVIDYGEGIEEDEIPYIWDRYYKSKKSHKRSVIGTGLGLSIVKSIIETHDGEYGVESKKGVGSKFWFSIKYV